jgi:hypothetical protein
VGPRDLQALFAAVRLQHGVAGPAQHRGQEGPDAGVVFNEQHCFRGGVRPYWSRGAPHDCLLTFAARQVNLERRPESGTAFDAN